MYKKLETTPFTDVVEKFLGKWGRGEVGRTGETRRDDRGCGRLWFCRRSQREGVGGIWPTLSKPQIYDIGGASVRHIGQG